MIVERDFDESEYGEDSAEAIRGFIESISPRCPECGNKLYLRHEYYPIGNTEFRKDEWYCPMCGD